MQWSQKPTSVSEMLKPEPKTFTVDLISHGEYDNGPPHYQRELAQKGHSTLIWFLKARIFPTFLTWADCWFSLLPSSPVDGEHVTSDHRPSRPTFETVLGLNPRQSLRWWNLPPLECRRYTNYGVSWHIRIRHITGVLTRLYFCFIFI